MNAASITANWLYNSHEIGSSGLRTCRENRREFRIPLSPKITFQARTRRRKLVRNGTITSNNSTYFILRTQRARKYPIGYDRSTTTIETVREIRIDFQNNPK